MEVEASSIIYSCKFCNKEIPAQLIKLQQTPDATQWIKSGFCSKVCYNGMSMTPDERKETLNKNTEEANKLVETKILEEKIKQTNTSKPSELKTFGREFAHKAVGQAQMTLGYFLIIIGVIVGIVFIRSD